MVAKRNYCDNGCDLDKKNDAGNHISPRQRTWVKWVLIKKGSELMTIKLDGKIIWLLACEVMNSVFIASLECDFLSRRVVRKVVCCVTPVMGCLFRHKSQ